MLSHISSFLFTHKKKEYGSVIRSQGAKWELGVKGNENTLGRDSKGYRIEDGDWR